MSTTPLTLQPRPAIDPSVDHVIQAIVSGASTEATLVKVLEEKGIGRPSTYASIIQTIQNRGYVFRLGKALVVPFTQERLADGSGYRLVIHAPLEGFPGETEEADCLRINQWVERVLRECPEQYLWAHRRFKSRPEGAPRLYDKKKR